jgi:hypothetical protein
MQHLSKIATLAALPLLGLGIASAGPAAAAPLPPNASPNSTITLSSQGIADDLVAQGQGSINKNIDVPAGVSIKLEWTTVNGNVRVEGQLGMAHDVVNGNVTVTGSGSGGIDGAGLSLYNGASHITGNLIVTGSGGYWGGNAYGWTLFDNADGTTQVDGGLTFMNNAGALYISNGGMHVAGKFTASGNDMSHWTKDGLTVSGRESILP